MKNELEKSNNQIPYQKPILIMEEVALEEVIAQSNTSGLPLNGNEEVTGGARSNDYRRPRGSWEDGE